MSLSLSSPSTAVLDLLLDAVCLVDEAGRFTFVSAAIERILGYRPHELLGRHMIDYVHSDDRARTLAAARDIMSGEPKTHFENRYLHKDGHAVHIMWSARWSPEDRLRVAVARDVTELRRAERLQAATYAISEAVHATEHLDQLFEHLHHVILGLLPAPRFFVALWHPDEQQLRLHFEAGEGAVRTLKTPPLVGAPFTDVMQHGRPLLLNLSPPQGSPTPTPPGGDQAWLGVPLPSSQGALGVMGLSSPLSGCAYTERDMELLQYVAAQAATAIERKQMQARLMHSARHDALTGLPNRVLLFERLEAALTRTRQSDAGLSLLYLDLDKFKQVNDAHGHATGDALLRVVAQRITACLRSVDTVARMGGDEFVVVLESVHRPDDAQAVADKIKAAVYAPLEVDGVRLRVMPSIGIAHHPQHGEDARALLTHADKSMYAQKTCRHTMQPTG